MTDTSTRIPVNIEDEMKRSYMDYAMSVIIGRALPDVRDGLKPAHRRVLFGMRSMGLASNRGYRKCAKIVGEVMGNFHPHGDASIYDTLVRLAQDFNMRYPLVDGQGNFGSIDDDPPAAMRYTEARPEQAAEAMMTDLDKETVDFVPNYDETTEEPTVLPTTFPNLLVNGSSGIAVGMATNIPPHNMREVIDAVIGIIEHRTESKEARLRALFKAIPGPDFPTGGFIVGRAGIYAAYTTGRGSITLRAKAKVEESRKGEKVSIVITEIPYQVNKKRLLEKIGELHREKTVEGISDLRDESDRDGMRIVVELRRGEVPEVVLNNLYKHTQLQTTFGIIMLAIAGGRPKVLPLLDIIEQFVEFRREVVRRRTEFELRKAEARAHILEGLKIALDHLDEVIRLIRASKSPSEAREGLMTEFKLSQVQSQAILDMQLQRLTGLERQKIADELVELLKTIERLRAILSSDEILMQLVVDELKAVRDRFADDRRTEIIEESGEFRIEDLIADEDMAITVTNTGYVKRTAISTYRMQRRGGKGRIGMRTREEDFVSHLFVASTHSYIMIFSDRGRGVLAAGPRDPRRRSGRQGQGHRQSRLDGRGREDRGAPRHQGLARGRQPAVRRDGHAQGRGEEDGPDRVQQSARGRDHRHGCRGRGLRDCRRDDGRQGAGVHRHVRRHGHPVRRNRRPPDGPHRVRRSRHHPPRRRRGRGDGSRARGRDDAHGDAERLREAHRARRYRVQSRGGVGIINIQTSERNGKVVGIAYVHDDDELMLISQQGKILRMVARGVRAIGRATQGVRLLGVEEGDEVVSVARLAEREGEENGVTESPDTDADTPNSE